MMFLVGFCLFVICCIIANYKATNTLRLLATVGILLMVVSVLLKISQYLP